MQRTKPGRRHVEEVRQRADPDERRKLALDLLRRKAAILQEGDDDGSLKKESASGLALCGGDRARHDSSVDKRADVSRFGALSEGKFTVELYAREQ